MLIDSTIRSIPTQGRVMPTSTGQRALYADSGDYLVRVPDDDRDILALIEELQRARVARAMACG